MTPTPQAIICLAHGSRHPEADSTIAAVATEVQRRTGIPALPAHLDFHPATLTHVAHLLAARGLQRVAVVPLLFTDAFHMKVDVPQAVAEARAETGLELQLTEGLGLGEEMEEIFAGHIREHGQGSARADVAVVSVGSSIPGANVAVADFARRAAARAGYGQARAFVATGGGAGDDRTALLSYLAERNTRRRGTPVVPLFVGPGLLWDRLCQRMPQGSCPAPHLGTSVAGLVAARAGFR